MTYQKLRVTSLCSESTNKERSYWGKLATYSVNYSTKNKHTLLTCSETFPQKFP